MQKFNSKYFQSNIKEINWSLATENDDVDLGFETFFKLFSRTLDKHVLYKEIRKKNETITLKPWITKGIKQSIKVRDRFYKDMIRTRNMQLRQIKEKSFKKYRNKIVDLIKINRKSQYHKFFVENKRNSKAIWQGIHDIIYSKESNRINTPSVRNTVPIG